MSDRFSQLPQHLLEYLLDIITKRLDLDDLLRFSCVCQQWRSFSAPLLPPKHLPWLIVPGGYCSKQGIVLNKTLAFFSFHDRKTYKLELPQISNRRICGSCKAGWLITLHENGEIQLLHPFSKSVIELPPVSLLPGVVASLVPTKKVEFFYIVQKRLDTDTVEDMLYVRAIYMREFYIYKGIMSSTCPATAIVMAICGVFRKLAFCRPRTDKKWILVHGDPDVKFEDIVFCRGDFYALQDQGNVYLVCGLDSASPFVKLVISDESTTMYFRHHLVVSYGELFMLTRVRHPMDLGDEEAHLTLGFAIRRVDINCLEWVHVEEIDKDSACFVWCNDSLTLSAQQFPACKKNSVYFTDDCLGPFISGPLGYDVEGACYARQAYGTHDIGVYTFTDEVFDRFYPSASKLFKPPPVWFSTSLY